MNLIKLSNHHYIVVDDSEIKEGVNQYYYDRYIKGIRNSSGAQYGETQLVITHSTQTLGVGWQQEIIELSLSEVEEVINGYNVGKLAELHTIKMLDNYKSSNKNSFIEGFKAHKELTKDKLFTVEDMLRAIEMARLIFDGKETFECEDIAGLTETDTYGWKNKYSDEQIIQSLLPKTEWDCCISDGKLVLL